MVVERWRGFECFFDLFLFSLPLLRPPGKKKKLHFLTAPGSMYSLWIWFRLKNVPPVASPSNPDSTLAGNRVCRGESKQRRTDTQSMVLRLSVLENSSRVPKASGLFSTKVCKPFTPTAKTTASRSAMSTVWPVSVSLACREVMECVLASTPTLSTALPPKIFPPPARILSARGAKMRSEIEPRHQRTSCGKRVGKKGAKREKREERVREREGREKQMGEKLENPKQKTHERRLRFQRVIVERVERLGGRQLLRRREQRHQQRGLQEVAVNGLRDADRPEEFARRHLVQARVPLWGGPDVRRRGDDGEHARAI